MNFITVTVGGLDEVGEHRHWQSIQGPIDHMLAQVKVQALAAIASWGPTFSCITAMDLEWEQPPEPRQPNTWLLKAVLHVPRIDPDMEHGSPVRETFLAAVAGYLELSIRLRWSQMSKSLEVQRAEP